MTKLNKILCTILLISLFLVPTMAAGQPETPERSWLYAKNLLDETEKPVGIMISEEMCVALARALNEWASAPPVTPLVFSCRVPMVSA